MKNNLQYLSRDELPYPITRSDFQELIDNPGHGTNVVSGRMRLLFREDARAGGIEFIN